METLNHGDHHVPQIPCCCSTRNTSILTLKRCLFCDDMYDMWVIGLSKEYSEWSPRLHDIVVSKTVVSTIMMKNDHDSLTVLTELTPSPRKKKLPNQIKSAQHSFITVSSFKIPCLTKPYSQLPTFSPRNRSPKGEASSSSAASWATRAGARGFLGPIHGERP